MTKYNSANPPRLTKTYDASVKMTGRSGTALVSVFNNIDAVGDRVMPGSFAKSIAQWKEKMARGLRPAYVWSHQWLDPAAFLGPITDLRETAKGLEVDFEITADTPFAKQVAWLLSEGLVNQQSFSYNVIDERTARDGANELVELDFWEAGPCLRGANDQTDLLAMKSAVQELYEKAHGQRTVTIDPPGRTMPAFDDLLVKERYKLKIAALEKDGDVVGGDQGGGSAPDRIPIRDHIVVMHGILYNAVRLLRERQLRDLHTRLHADGVIHREHNESDTTAKTAPDRVDEFVAQVRAQRTEQKRLREIGQANSERARQAALSGVTPEDVAAQEAERFRIQHEALAVREAKREKAAAWAESQEEQGRRELADAFGIGEVS